MSAPPGDAVPPTAGRRARSTADKHRRIFAAAAELFNERGFEAVTTQEIADRADVATGTVFRYASSKGELLLMVYNEKFREAIEAGTRAAANIDDPAAAAVALIDSIIAFAADNPQNSVLYQRELLFGPPEEAYRAEGIGLVEELEAAIARRLVGATQAPGADPAAVERGAARAARSVFAALSLLLAQPSTGVRWGGDGEGELREQIAQIVRGYLVSVGAHTGTGQSPR
jgi:AcrR family transcriptional regulator